ncbi:unnamed protein product [Camellia sinensis]
MLAIAWDRKVQVAKLVQSELKIYGKWTLESSAIGVAWLDDQMLVVLTSNGQLCLFAKDGTVIHLSLLFSLFKPSLFFSVGNHISLLHPVSSDGLTLLFLKSSVDGSATAFLVDSGGSGGGGGGLSSNRVGGVEWRQIWSR